MKCNHLACEKRCGGKRGYQEYIDQYILPVQVSLYLLFLRLICEQLVSDSTFPLPPLLPGFPNITPGALDEVLELCFSQMRAEQSYLDVELTQQQWCDINVKLRDTLSLYVVETDRASQSL